MQHPPRAIMTSATHPVGMGASGVERVLVVDDSHAQRRMLASLLKRWGHCVVDCDNAAEALEIAQDPAIGLVISDWMMPGMTGPEFCRALRKSRRDGYAYFLLLTSNSEAGALTEGLEAGADDFLAKPVRPPELRARLQAGARIVAMQREVVEKNRLLTDALGEIRQLYAALDQDLEEANRLQMAQMQDRFHSFGNVGVSLWLEAAGPVGGDMVGCFPVNDDVIGAFNLDVSGHGVASAMIAARVAGILSAATPDQNIALTRREDGSLCALSPDMAAVRLNRMVLRETRGDRYFTMCMGFLNRHTGHMRLVQAGHPYPIVLRADGTSELAGDGGLPIGLIDDARYRSFDIVLRPGDRLLIHTDGLTESPNPDGTCLEEAGLADRLGGLAHLRGPDFLTALRAELAEFTQADSLPDDASALLIEYGMDART